MTTPDKTEPSRRHGLRSARRSTSSPPTARRGWQDSPPARCAASTGFTAHPAGVPEPRRVRLANVYEKSAPLREYPERRTGPLSQSLFGGKTPMADALPPPAGEPGDTGCPRLEDALASFDCRISPVVSVGTTTFCFATLFRLFCHPAPQGLVWFDRSYHALMRPAC